MQHREELLWLRKRHKGLADRWRRDICGGTAGGGAGGMSRVARVLTYFGPRKTLQESIGFSTGLASSSSRNTEFRCPQ